MSTNIWLTLSGSLHLYLDLFPEGDCPCAYKEHAGDEISPSACSLSLSLSLLYVCVYLKSCPGSLLYLTKDVGLGFLRLSKHAPRSFSMPSCGQARWV